jgi:hypothetical protein
VMASPQYGDIASGPVAERSLAAQDDRGWWASRDYYYSDGVAIGSDYVRVRSADGWAYVYPW